MDNTGPEKCSRGPEALMNLLIPIARHACFKEGESAQRLLSPISPLEQGAPSAWSLHTVPRPGPPLCSILLPRSVPPPPRLTPRCTPSGPTRRGGRRGRRCPSRSGPPRARTPRGALQRRRVGGAASIGPRVLGRPAGPRCG